MIWGHPKRVPGATDVRRRMALCWDSHQMGFFLIRGEFYAALQTAVSMISQTSTQKSKEINSIMVALGMNK